MSTRRRHPFRSPLTMGMVFLIVKSLTAVPVVGAVEWQPGRPEHYRVTEGDTLWSIAGRFLRHPWEWSEVWRGNPDIHDPNRIYPGDVIVFEHRGGHPHLRLAGQGTERLSPEIRVTPLGEPIPVVPSRAISPFLSRPRVIEDDPSESAPYVVGLAEEHVLGGPGDTLYVRAIDAWTPSDFTVLRPGAAYRDPDTGATLGYEAIYIADVRLSALGDPASVVVMQAEKEARIGDRLLPMQPIKLSQDFVLQRPRPGLNGHILGVLDGVSQIGQYSVVSIDRGRQEGVRVGDVFEIWQQGEVLRDVVNPRFGEKVVGAEQQAGVLMVFSVYRQVSYGLVMEARRFIHVLDRVRGVP